MSPELRKFDLDALGAALKPERDHNFTYLGLQTLYDRYFIHSNDVRFELPQVFFMRVAMGLALEEADRTARAIEFYDLLSSFDYMSSTPTLFNAGTLRSQLSSCFLTTVPDDLDGIYGAIHDNAMLSKWAGGLGNDWTPVRALGAYIKGTNGKSQGVVPFLKVVNDTAVAVNQGGKRKGAVCSYLETWHLDIEEFIELRKNTGDDRRRTHDMNTANWIPDLFMKRVFEDGTWTLFSPSDVPDLHDLYGLAFEHAYTQYERKTETRRTAAVQARPRAGSVAQDAVDAVRNRASVDHVQGRLQRPLAAAARRRGAFVEPLHRDHAEHRRATKSPCATSARSTSCSTSTKDGLDLDKLRRTVRTAVRMLDNVIDINYYSVAQARASNMRHRPVGLGIMGFQDALYELRIPYSSDAAVEFADESMEAVSYFAIEASSELAKERGSYASFEGSLWSRGSLAARFAAPARARTRQAISRSELRLDARLGNAAPQGEDRRHAQLERHGDCANRDHRQHHRRVAIDRADVSEPVRQIEPVRRVHRRQSLHGARPEGARSVGQGHGQRPQVLRRQPAGDRPRAGGPEAALRDRVRSRAALARRRRRRRQKWIDQAQSLNLYIAGASGKKLDVTYRMAWIRGLKTTYYLRALSATSTEKSTVDRGTLNAVSAGASQACRRQRRTRTVDVTQGDPAEVPLACSIDNPDCEACQ